MWECLVTGRDNLLIVIASNLFRNNRKLVKVTALALVEEHVKAEQKIQICQKYRTQKNELPYLSAFDFSALIRTVMNKRGFSLAFEQVRVREH